MGHTWQVAMDSYEMTQLSLPLPLVVEAARVSFTLIGTRLASVGK